MKMPFDSIFVLNSSSFSHDGHEKYDPTAFAFSIKHFLWLQPPLQQSNGIDVTG